MDQDRFKLRYLGLFFYIGTLEKYYLIKLWHVIENFPTSKNLIKIY
jgi:hypothetical protein